MNKENERIKEKSLASILGQKRNIKCNVCKNRLKVGLACYVCENCKQSFNIKIINNEKKRKTKWKQIKNYELK